MPAFAREDNDTSSILVVLAGLASIVAFALPAFAAKSGAGAESARRHLSQDDAYRWFSAPGATDMAYGVPYTDDRALRLSCHPGGTDVMVAGYLSGRHKAGQRIRVSFRTYRGDEDVQGTVEEGDSLQFVVRVAPDGAVVRSLAADGAVTYTVDGRTDTVPGDRASTAITSMLKACAGAEGR